MNSFKQLCQENYARIYNYIFAMVKDSFLAEDLTQEVFTTAFLKGDIFLKHESPPAFLYRTAKLKVLEAFREKGRGEVAELNEDAAGIDVEPLQVLMREKDRQIDETQFVPKVMGRLSKNQLDLYQRYYIEKKPMKQIAKELGIKEAALKMRYVRLRRDVKKIVKEINMGEFSGKEARG